MSNFDNRRKINTLDESAAALDAAGEARHVDDETIPDYLMRVGILAKREVSIFAGVKRPKRRKPTFAFPPVPSLF
jgi:hypothetical protein